MEVLSAVTHFAAALVQANALVWTKQLVDDGVRVLNVSAGAFELVASRGTEQQVQSRALTARIRCRPTVMHFCHSLATNPFGYIDSEVALAHAIYMS